MNLFQWLTIPVLIGLIALNLRAFVQDHRRSRLVRTVVWFVASILILYPELASQLARQLGIGRGTDLVTYAFMLATIGMLFHLYGRQFVMRRDLVTLARRDALRSPVPGHGLVLGRDLPQSDPDVGNPDGQPG